MILRILRFKEIELPEAGILVIRHLQISHDSWFALPSGIDWVGTTQTIAYLGYMLRGSG